MKYLCYYELHVEDRTYYVHKVVEATSKGEALSKLESEHGEGYHLQAKGCVGEATLENMFEYLDEVGDGPSRRVGATRFAKMLAQANAEEQS